MQVDEELNCIISRHNTLVSCYKETIAIKKAYLSEISDEIISKKVELADQIYVNLEKMQKRMRSSQFSSSDLMGIEKTTVVILNNRTLTASEEHSFSTIDDEFLEHIIKLVEEKRLFLIKLKLLDVKNFENNYQNRDSFYEKHSKETAKRNRSFIIRSETSLSGEDENLSTDGTPTPKKVTAEGYERILILKGNKKIREEVQQRLSMTYIPNNLKYSVYNCLIANNNFIDQVFYEYYSSIDSRMPRHVEDVISDNVRTGFCMFSYFNANLEDQVMRVLKIFYNYRPDIGYKTGMELYAITLGINMSDSKLLKIFIAVMLDIDIIFGVFKGIDDILQNYQSIIINELDKFKRSDLIQYKELIYQFFSYSCSVLFVYAFSLGSLKKLMDILITYGSKTLVVLFIEILMFVEIKDLKNVQNCYQMEKIISNKIKNVCETKVLKNVIINIRGN